MHNTPPCIDRACLGAVGKTHFKLINLFRSQYDYIGSLRRTLWRGCWRRSRRGSPMTTRGGSRRCRPFSTSAAAESPATTTPPAASTRSCADPCAVRALSRSVSTFLILVWMRACACPQWVCATLCLWRANGPCLDPYPSPFSADGRGRARHAVHAAPHLLPRDRHAHRYELILPFA